MSERSSYKPRRLSAAAEDYQTTVEQRAEADVLAAQFLKEYGSRKRGAYDLLKRYPNDEGIQSYWTEERIEDHATGAEESAAIETLRGKPFDEVTYHDLHAAAVQDERQTFAVYSAMTEAVKDHVEAGVRASSAMGFSKPYERIEFAVIRKGFIDEWQPRGGIEMALIDMLAQSYTAWQFWLGSAMDGARNVDMPSDQITRKTTVFEKGSWEGPRLTQKEWYDHAMQMADRFNRVFLRVLRQMRDLRRYSSPVVIQNAGQVNVAADGGQQMNVQQGAKKQAKQPAVSSVSRLKVAE